MRLLLLTMWVGWLAYRAIAARDVKAAQWRGPLSANWPDYALALLGAIALAVPHATPAILAQPFVPPGPIGAPIARGFGLILTALGLGIAIAAHMPRSRSKKIMRWSAAAHITGARCWASP
jgi:hypothetical protein